MKKILVLFVVLFGMALGQSYPDSSNVRLGKQIKPEDILVLYRAILGVGTWSMGNPSAKTLSLDSLLSGSNRPNLHIGSDGTLYRTLDTTSGVADTNRLATLDKIQTFTGEKTFSDTTHFRFVLPDASATYELGSLSYKWQDLHSNYVTAYAGYYLNDTQWMDVNRVIANATWTGTSIDTTYTDAVSKLVAGSGISVEKGSKAYVVTSIAPQVLTCVFSGTFNTDRYSTFSSDGPTVADNVKFVAPFAFTMSSLYVRNQSVDAGASTGYVVVLKNGASGADSLKTSFSSGATTSDLTSTISFVAGDLVSIWLNVGTGTVANVSATVKIIPNL